MMEGVVNIEMPLKHPFSDISTCAKFDLDITCIVLYISWLGHLVRVLKVLEVRG